MKRLRHILFNVAVAISLALFTASLVMCARSFECHDCFQYVRLVTPRVRGYVWHLAIGFRGDDVNIEITRIDAGANFRDQKYPHDGIFYEQGRSALSEVSWGEEGKVRTLSYFSRFVSFFLVNVRYFPSRHQTTPAALCCIFAPPWLIIPPLAIFPAVEFYRWRRARRLSQMGVCSSCGYDLRATPRRCPECGKHVAV